MSTLKAVKSHFKQTYDKQNLTLVVISYEMTTRVRSSMYITTVIHIRGRAGTLTFHQQIPPTGPALRGQVVSKTSTVVFCRLSFLLTSCLTSLKNHLIKYWKTIYERDGINLFLSIKNSNEVLNKFKSKGFKASKLSTYDFATLVYGTTSSY